jgi:hypothetical protein
MTITRRGFLGRLLTGVAGVALGPALATLLPAAPVPALAFHPEAFQMAMSPLRFDVLYGIASRMPATSCRVWVA